MKKLILESKLKEFQSKIPSNFSELVEFLAEHGDKLSLEETSASLESLIAHYSDFKKILSEFPHELFERAPPGSQTDIEGTFISHSNETQIQSIENLSAITDYME